MTATPQDDPTARAKAALRARLVAQRDALDPTERARIASALAAALAALPEYAAARSVLATMAIGSEWNTRVFLERARADGKAIVLPRITAPPRHLEVHRVPDPERDLVPGIWDIPEPDPARCPRVDIAEVDFAVVPALAVDLEGYRIGYGAGYFDRLLAGRGPRTFCATALPAGFVLPQVPHAAHDVRVHAVVDERGGVHRTGVRA